VHTEHTSAHSPQNDSNLKLSIQPHANKWQFITSSAIASWLAQSLAANSKGNLQPQRRAGMSNHHSALPTWQGPFPLTQQEARVRPLIQGSHQYQAVDDLPLIIFHGFGSGVAIKLNFFSFECISCSHP